jgi:hypothetical protein
MNPFSACLLWSGGIADLRIYIRIILAVTYKASLGIRDGNRNNYDINITIKISKVTQFQFRLRLEYSKIQNFDFDFD